MDIKYLIFTDYYKVFLTNIMSYTIRQMRVILVETRKAKVLLLPLLGGTLRVYCR